MQTKTIKTNINNLNKLNCEQEIFGWKFVNSTVLRKNFVQASYAKDENVKLNKDVSRLEKQYNKILNRFPIPSIIWFIGFIFLLILNLIIDNSTWDLISTILTFSCLSVSLVLALFFALSKVRKETLLKIISDEAKRILNPEESKPIITNIQKPGKYTYILKRKLRIIMNSLKK